MRGTLRERFEDKFTPEPNSGCWIWVANLNRQTGYGMIGIGSKLTTVPRAAWTIYRGPIPRGKHVLHHCDQRWCCNPDHLFVGTNHDNILDAVAKGRLRGNGGLHKPNLRGEQCYQAKLNESKVRKIRASSDSVRVLAKRFGVSHHTNHSIEHKKIWRHVS